MTNLLKKQLAAVLGTVAIAAACAAPAPAGLTDADRDGIQAVSDQFGEAVRAGDFATVASLYTEDAMLMPPNHEPVTGRAAIEEFFGTFPPLKQFHYSVESVEGHGEMAHVVGSVHLVMEGPDGTDIEDTMKFIEIRRKVGDQWLLAYDIFNSNAPLPTGEEVD